MNAKRDAVTTGERIRAYWAVALLLGADLALAQPLGDLLKRGVADARRAAEKAATDAARAPADALPAQVTSPANASANSAPPGASTAAAASTAAGSTAGSASELFPWVKDLSRAPAPPTGERGSWFRWDNQYGQLRSQFTRGGITGAQADAWDQQMQEIAAFIRQAPVLREPAGFYPQIYGSITVLNAGIWNDKPKQAPLAGGVTLRAWAPRDVVFAGDGTPLRPKGEVQGLRIELNFVYEPQGQRWMTDAQGDFGPLVTQGEFAGFPIIGNALVLTRDGRLPFKPVSQERVLRAFLENYRDERAVRAARAQLDAMSETERKRPAFVAGNGDPTAPALVAGNSPGAAPLVALDPLFFDAGQPRHTIRIALVRELHNIADAAHRGGARLETQGPRVGLLTLQQTDWKRFVERFLK